MPEIKLSKKAKAVIEQTRDQTPDLFDFNTAPPQKPGEDTEPETRLREILRIFNANDRTVDEYKRLADEGETICQQLPAETVEWIFTEVAGPATARCEVNHD